MNLSFEDIHNFLRSDDSFLQKSFEDFEGTTLQVFIGVFEKLTVPADELDKGFFLQDHKITCLLACYKIFLSDLKPEEAEKSLDRSRGNSL
jgi:hypothetical protein